MLTESVKRNNDLFRTCNLNEIDSNDEKRKKKTKKKTFFLHFRQQDVFGNFGLGFFFIACT